MLTLCVWITQYSYVVGRCSSNIGAGAFSFGNINNGAGELHSFRVVLTP